MKLLTIYFSISCFLAPLHHLVMAQNLPVTSVPKVVDMDIIAKDGVKLKSTYYSPGNPGPGLLLLHQCNSDRKCWDAFEKAASQKGVHVITFDFRGFGETPKAGGMWPNLIGDIDAVFSQLTKLPGVNKNLAVGGASCGLEPSIELAKRSGKIKALLLLGTTSDEGLQYLREKHPPIFCAASDKDLGNKRMTEMVAISSNPMSKMTILKDGPDGDAAHGVTLFKADPTLFQSAVDWIEMVLTK